MKDPVKRSEEKYQISKNHDQRIKIKDPSIKIKDQRVKIKDQRVKIRDSINSINSINECEIITMWFIINNSHWSRWFYQWICVIVIIFIRIFMVIMCHGHYIQQDHYDRMGYNDHQGHQGHQGHLIIKVIKNIKGFMVIMFIRVIRANRIIMSIKVIW